MYALLHLSPPWGLHSAHITLLSRLSLPVVREVSFSTWRGTPENWGDEILFLDQKGGIAYIFKKKQNILLNISDSRERDCQMQLGD